MSGQESRETGSEALAGADQAQIGAAVSQIAGEWGGEVLSQSSGRLELALPVAAGLRLGQVRLSVSVPSLGGRVDWEIASQEWRLHRQATVVLALGAAGSLAAAAWPFFPALLPIASIGVVLALAAWLLVSARVQYRGVEQFWSEVREEIEAACQADHQDK